MFQIVYSPQWFYAKDVIIDIIGAIVLFFIGLFSFQNYKINKNKNYLFLALSFFLISLSYVFKILTNFTIYYSVTETKDLFFGTITYQTIESSNLMFMAGFLLYRLLALIGLYLLYSIYEKQSKSNMLLVIYLILVSAYFSHSAYFVFHITALILLILITLNFHCTCKKNKQSTSRLLFISFLIITISHIMSIFVIFSAWLYVIAEIIQLAGYILLLVMFIMVLKHAKKKNKN